MQYKNIIIITIIIGKKYSNNNSTNKRACLNAPNKGTNSLLPMVSQEYVGKKNVSTFRVPMSSEGEIIKQGNNMPTMITIHKGLGSGWVLI